MQCHFAAQRISGKRGVSRDWRGIFGSGSIVPRLLSSRPRLSSRWPYQVPAFSASRQGCDLEEPQECHRIKSWQNGYTQHVASQVELLGSVPTDFRALFFKVVSQLSFGSWKKCEQKTSALALDQLAAPHFVSKTLAITAEQTSQSS